MLLVWGKADIWKVLNGTKVRVIFEKNIEKKHLCHHDKNS